MNVPFLAVFLLGCACAGMHGRSARDPGRVAMWAAAVAVCLVCGAVINVMGGQWPAAAIDLAGAAYWLWRSWRNWRRRKRAARSLGYKARRAMAAMLRNMPRPGPVLRPVPQGGGFG